MELQMGMKADSLNRPESTSLKPDRISLTISSHSSPHWALLTPSVFIIMRTWPLTARKFTAFSRGWLARRSSKTLSMMVSGMTMSRSSSACLGLVDFMASVTFCQ